MSVERCDEQGRILRAPRQAITMEAHEEVVWAYLVLIATTVVVSTEGGFFSEGRDGMSSDQG